MSEKKNKNNNNEIRKNSNGLLIIVIVLLVFNLIFSFLIYNKYYEIEKAISKNIGSIDLIIRRIGLIEISNIISNNGIVTDVFTVNKGHFKNSFAYIDLRMQSIHNNKYIGKGKFNLSDQELIKNLEEVINKIEEIYNDPSSYNVVGISSMFKFTDNMMPDFNKLSIYITINGYLIATYKNGEIELVK